MNRIGLIVLIVSVLSTAAFAQSGPRNLAGTDEILQQKQAPLQQSIVALYLSNFRNEVGLSEDQFLKVDPIVRRFILQRFGMANQKRALDERKEQLLSQPNPSPADLQTLNEQLTKLDNETGTWNSRFMRNLQPELTEYQRLRARDFNSSFINEKLPTLLERLRAENATKGQQQRPAGARANQNRKDQVPPPANTLRGTDTQPVQPRRKLAR